MTDPPESSERGQPNARGQPADCFKYRNKVGLDVAIEALRGCWQERMSIEGVEAAREHRRIVFMDDGLPCLDLLEATPAILRGLMSGVSDEDARWKPAADRFSIAEVLCHLSHSESHCYRPRVDRFLGEEMPEFEPDDAQMYLDLYRNADPEEEFARFEAQRATNIELLRGLPAEAGNRKARHLDAGEITLSQMLHEWALHDLGHIRQIAELVRARKYLAGAGRLGEEYNLRP